MSDLQIFGAVFVAAIVIGLALGLITFLWHAVVGSIVLWSLPNLGGMKNILAYSGLVAVTGFAGIVGMFLALVIGLTARDWLGTDRVLAQAAEEEASEVEGMTWE